jgi:hypothetical protein
MRNLTNIHKHVKKIIIHIICQFVDRKRVEEGAQTISHTEQAEQSINLIDGGKPRVTDVGNGTPEIYLCGKKMPKVHSLRGLVL